MGPWDDIKISKKLIIGFVTLIIVVSAGGFIGYIGLSKVEHSVAISDNANKIEKDCLEALRYDTQDEPPNQLVESESSSDSSIDKES